MAGSSHNGALVFGLLLGTAAGAAWAVWNTTEPGEKLRAETRAMIDAAFGRSHGASPAEPRVTITESAAAQPLVAREAALDHTSPIASSAQPQ